jgi:hypothetical protein
VHAVALVELQVSVLLAPRATEVGLAVKIAVGAEIATLTLETALLPPGPLHRMPKVVLAVSAPVDCEPLVARTPVQPPEAMQAVALVELQVSVLLPLSATVSGLADRLTVGGGVTVTVALAGALVPVEPVQVRV